MYESGFFTNNFLHFVSETTHLYDTLPPPQKKTQLTIPFEQYIAKSNRISQET